MNWSDVYNAKKEFRLRPFRFKIITQKEFEEKAIQISLKKNSEIVHFGCGKEKLTIPSIRIDIDKKVNPEFTTIKKIQKKRKISLLYAKNSIEHLNLKNIRELFKWCIKKNIPIAFNPPNAWASYGVFANDYTHKTNLSFRSYAGLLREAGFSEIHIYRIHEGYHSWIRDRIADIIGIDYAQTLGIFAFPKKGEEII